MSNHTPNLYIIAAMSENNVIGINNRLPWHLPDEWKNFKRLTDEKPFLMGRKSFEAPDALHSSYRNVVISSKTHDGDNGTEYAKDLNEALALLGTENEVFILGGASVFEQAISIVGKLFLTIVHAHVEGDAFFPTVSLQDWELTSSEYHGVDPEHVYAFSMNQYVRKTSDSG